MLDTNGYNLDGHPSYYQIFEKLFESKSSRNEVGVGLGDGLKCSFDCDKKPILCDSGVFGNNCEDRLPEGGDLFVLGGRIYTIADGLRFNQIAALSFFNGYLNGRISIENLFQGTVMNRKRANKLNQHC